MARAITELYENFSAGVITSAPPDQLPKNAGAVGKNSQLTSLGPSVAIPATRGGFTFVNSDLVETSAGGGTYTPLTGQYDYKRSDGSHIHVLAPVGNYIARLNSDGTVTSYGAAGAWNTAVAPDFATANDLCFIADGVNGLKLNNTTAQPWGFTRPSAPTVTPGFGSAMTGAYEFAISWYNNVTGHESSRSDEVSATLTADGAQVSWSGQPATATHVRVHIRKGVLGSIFLQAAEVTASPAVIDLSDINYQNLIIASPGTTENEPPPTGVRYAEYHRSRMFVSVDDFIYPSKVDKPEAFDLEFFLPVNPSDGQTITALHSAHDALLIFKNNSIWALVGDDPGNWSIRLVAADIGAVSHRSVVTVEDTTYFWSEQGPMAMRGLGKPVAIGQVLIEPDTSIAFAYLSNVVAVPDITNQRVLFGVTDSGETTSNRLIPYSYRLNAWESTEWNPINLSSLAVVENTLGEPIVYLGTTNGRVMRYTDSQTYDGPATGTQTGTLTASGTSLSSITGTGFYNTDDGLRGMPIYVVRDSTGVATRVLIASNTATTLTLATSVTVVNGAAYTYYIGGIDFEWSTRWSFFDSPFTKKRFEYLYLEFTSTTSGANVVNVDCNFDYNVARGQTQGLDSDVVSGAGLWDSALWDVSSWGELARSAHRLRVGRTGKSYQVTIRSLRQNAGIVLHHVGMRVVPMGDKR